MADDAAAAPDDAEPAIPSDDAAGKPAKADDLGPEGVKALEAWKSRAKAAEKDAKRAQTLEAELEKFRSDAMSEQERAIADARKEAAEAARNEVLGEVLRDRVADRIRAAAGTQLNDPEDAVRLLDPEEFIDDGQIKDGSIISAAIATLLKDKPYLSAMPGTGSGEGGPRGAASPKPGTSDPLLRDVQRLAGIQQ